MNKLKISTRLALLVAALSLLTIIIGAFGLNGIRQTNAGVEAVYKNNTVPLEQISFVQERMLRNRLTLAVATLTPEAQIIENANREVERLIADMNMVWEQYFNGIRSAEEKEMAGAFAAAQARFVQEGMRPALAALVNHDVAAALRIIEERVRPLYEPVGQGIRQMKQYQIDAAAREFAAAEARYDQTRTLTIGVILLGLLFAAVSGWLLIRAITRSLAGAVAVANAVAEGDLTVPVEARGGDEIAQLMHALAQMKDNLVRLVRQVRGDAEGVAAASAQIAQGNLDLSSRTEEQASALEQTAASMEELSSTVRQNADNARMADQLARGANTVATQGGEVVGEVIETMRGINDGSQRIADIIGTIDGIAFQTNILALNAAVEAARAGQQGRGFAVVAGEVRSLAQRSAEAAHEIKNLITASVEQAAHGGALADKAGATMTEVVQSVVRVSDIMGEINSASAEQSSGVGQVAEAVSQMDQATQQNAALVEESAAAAHSLKEQAQRLVQAVAVFRLAGDGGLDTGRVESAAKPAVLARPAHHFVSAPLGAIRSGDSGHRSAAAAASSTIETIRRRTASTSQPAGSPVPSSGKVVSLASRTADDDDWQSF